MFISFYSLIVENKIYGKLIARLERMKCLYLVHNLRKVKRLQISRIFSKKKNLKKPNSKKIFSLHKNVLVLYLKLFFVQLTFLSGHFTFFSSKVFFTRNIQIFNDRRINLIFRSDPFFEFNNTLRSQVQLTTIPRREA